LGTWNPTARTTYFERLYADEHQHQQQGDLQDEEWDYEAHRNDRAWGQRHTEHKPEQDIASSFVPTDSFVFRSGCETKAGGDETKTGRGESNDGAGCGVGEAVRGVGVVADAAAAAAVRTGTKTTTTGKTTGRKRAKVEVASVRGSAERIKGANASGAASTNGNSATPANGINSRTPGPASLPFATVLRALSSGEVPILSGRNNTRTQGAEQVRCALTLKFVNYYYLVVLSSSTSSLLRIGGVEIMSLALQFVFLPPPSSLLSLYSLCSSSFLSSSFFFLVLLAFFLSCRSFAASAWAVWPVTHWGSPPLASLIADAI
jgi:hypothetical protein